MSDHADLLRKKIAAQGAGPAPLPALSDTTSVRSLAATGQMLNARPALVAQRMLSAALSRAPAQRMDNGQPEPAAEEWGDYQSGAAQQAPAANANPPAAAANPPPAANPAIAPANPVVVNAPAVANPANVAANPVVAANPPAPAANAPPAANPLLAPANPVLVNVPAVNVAAAPAAGAAVAAAAPAAANNGLKVETGAHRESNGPMYTTGLVNCIALVAYNPQTPLACLYHWDTRDGGLETVADEDGGRDEDGNENTHFVAHQPGVTAAKAVVDGAVPGATSYHAVLGPGWNRGALRRPRRAFIAMLRTTFNGIAIAPARRGNARWVAPDLTGY